LEFSLKPGVREQLARPLSEWKAGDTFDVTGLRAEANIDMWQDVLYLRAEALEVLREWESGKPYLAAFGSAGIGKSAMLQIAALRALVRGDPVLVQVRGVNTLMRMVDESRLSAESDVALEEWRHERPRLRRTSFFATTRRMAFK
jgi:hypothetical protein